MKESERHENMSEMDGSDQAADNGCGKAACAEQGHGLFSQTAGSCSLFLYDLISLTSTTR